MWCGGGVGVVRYGTGQPHTRTMQNKHTHMRVCVCLARPLYGKMFSYARASICARVCGGEIRDGKRAAAAAIPKNRCDGNRARTQFCSPQLERATPLRP